MADKSGVLAKKKLFEVGIRQKLFTLISECQDTLQRHTEKNRICHRKPHLPSGLPSQKPACSQQSEMASTSGTTPAKRGPSKKKKSLSWHAEKTDRHILLLLLQNETNTNEELSKILSLSPSTISWHHQKTRRTNILSVKVEGRKAFYSVSNPELVGES